MNPFATLILVALIQSQSPDSRRIAAYEGVDHLYKSVPAESGPSGWWPYGDCRDALLWIRDKIGLDASRWSELADCYSRLGQFDSALSAAKQTKDASIIRKYAALVEVSRGYRSSIGNKIVQIIETSPGHFAILVGRSPTDIGVLKAKVEFAFFRGGKLLIQQDFTLTESHSPEYARRAQIYLCKAGNGSPAILATEDFYGGDYEPYTVETFQPSGPGWRRTLRAYSDRGVGAAGGSMRNTLAYDIPTERGGYHDNDALQPFANGSAKDHAALLQTALRLSGDSEDSSDPGMSMSQMPNWPNFYQVTPRGVKKVNNRFPGAYRALRTYVIGLQKTRPHNRVLWLMRWQIEKLLGNRQAAARLKQRFLRAGGRLAGVSILDSTDLSNMPI